ncbi:MULTISPECIES: hypothetical protein [Alkalihalophilus]|uniref:hypothetical protein n=1 Tax=Alkalihalophilus TaxID=2893060 RepID=UPI0009521A30|nr:hypothetical protein [Alkalihalophilus marmarensis]MEC2073594.1 hypothetical protein [Alkalihalophilus marmarensis]OLS36939.1 hypothetical protein BTR22_09580 [Alkalihalophilus pseudofirmus]
MKDVQKEVSYIKGIAITLVSIGVLGLLLSTMMYGDIGIAAAIASITALLSGVGFLKMAKQLN